MRHMPQLDGLRAFAVLGVLINHCFAGDAALYCGWFGVRLFFVLSGFLITGILLDARQKGHESGEVLKAFYARRFLRIFPLYYAVLAVAVIGSETVREAFGWHALYVTNWLVASGGNTGVATHFWSLAVEEQFYLFWPFVILFTPRRWLLPVVVAFILSGSVYRLACVALDVNAAARFGTPGMFDCLCGGALLALLRSRVDRRLLWASSAAGLALFIASAIVVKGRDVTLDSAFALIGVPLVAWAAAGKVPGRLLTAAPVMYVGKISYGIYVLHTFVIAVGGQLGIEEGLPRLAFSASVSVALAALSWHFFERPLTDLKRHFPYSGRLKRAVEPEPVVA